ncbi:MAG: dockerin type I repeat-containing protein [Oscillospiraceae bacterium]|nr:dockerin type I repeat-containing protein [Oscillospiraceae bacterium]
MKKRIRFAALLTGITMLCCTQPVQAAQVTTEDIADIYCWGTATGDVFQNMTLLNDKGWFGYDLLYKYSFISDEPMSDTHHQLSNVMYGVNRRNALRFVLRNDLDAKEAEKKADTIVQKYYPNCILTDAFDTKTYDIFEEDESKRTAKISDDLMHDLAQAGLISAFYTWGQTADYQLISSNYITMYQPVGWEWIDHKLEEVSYDWNAIETWVNENHPECKFVCVTSENIDTAKILGAFDSELNRTTFDDKVYAVIPPEGTDFSEHFALAVELHAQFGISARYDSPVIDNEPLIGQNALAVAGDANLDCIVDISDAILTARYAAEDTAVTMTASGIANADVNGDGILNGADTTAIVRKIAKLD